MKTIKGPAIFLAQFAGIGPHLQNFNDMCKWAAGYGYVGVQLPSWDGRVMDLAKAAESKTYCDELKGTAAKHGIEITELAAHLQGQLVAVHPAYDLQFDNFAPKEVHGNPKARQVWAVEQMKLVAKASKNLGLKNCAAFPGALAWPYLYPWPQRPPGLIEAAFDELAKRWRPILDVFKDNGQNCCYEVHPGEDIFDGTTFEMFLERVNGHEACQILFDPSHFVLQQLDYLEYIDIYKDRIKMFHVKDAEFRPTGRQGVYSGYASWVNRAGRFRSLGDGQVDFNGIFSKFAACDFAGWAVLEWECALKHPEDGAREGSAFIRKHIIRVTEKAFDDFAAGSSKPTAKFHGHSVAQKSANWPTRACPHCLSVERPEGISPRQRTDKCALKTLTPSVRRSLFLRAGMLAGTNDTLVTISSSTVSSLPSMSTVNGVRWMVRTSGGSVNVSMTDPAIRSDTCCGSERAFTG